MSVDVQKDFGAEAQQRVDAVLLANNAYIEGTGSRERLDAAGKEARTALDAYVAWGGDVKDLDFGYMDSIAGHHKGTGVRAFDQYGHQNQSPYSFPSPEES